jgi:hypothetical protein
MIPILGATLITCKSAMISSSVLFASRIITFAYFLSILFKAVSWSIESGMFLLFCIIFAISIIQLAIVPKFLTSVIYGISASVLETAKISIFGNISNSVGIILLILASDSCAEI